MNVLLVSVDKVISLDSDEEEDTLIVMDPPQREPPQSMLIQALQAPIAPILPPPPPPPAPPPVAASGSSPRQPTPFMQPVLVTPQGQTFVMPQAGQQLVLTDHQFNQIMQLQKQGMLVSESFDSINNLIPMNAFYSFRNSHVKSSALFS